MRHRPRESAPATANHDAPSPSSDEPSSESTADTPHHRQHVRSRRRYVNVPPPPPRFSDPILPFSWHEWGAAAFAAHPEPLRTSSTASLSAMLANVDSTITFDGSFLPDTRAMGLAFINHHHRLQQTHVECNGCLPHDDNSSMLAEALSFKASLIDALDARSKSLHIAADCKTLVRIALGRDVSNGIERNSAPFVSATSEIVNLLRQFDTVLISHVKSHVAKSHPCFFAENSAVDLLAGLASSYTDFAICDTLTNLNHNSLLRSILGMRKPRSCDLIAAIPYIDGTLPTCSTCKCPSHDHASCCFTNAAEAFPLLSIFCKTQPQRPTAFADQVASPELIDWSRAPASMGGDIFVRFTAICYNNLRHPDRHHAALHALHMFSKTYCLIHGHISKRKPLRHRTDLSSTPDTVRAHDEQLARDAKTAARLAHEFHYRDAAKVLDRQQPIGPLHPAAREQLPTLYPAQVDDPKIPPRAPVSGRATLDRHVVWSYVKSRSATSSPGISGYGFIWLQHFARLTVACETRESPDPNWTVLVALIEDLACGHLTWLQPWATCLKGALFAKTPDPLNIKLRNLGIAETLVRVAAYMVVLTAVPLAQASGFITAFDLGVGVPGGTEKFVKLAQLAADAGLTILSADLEKAFNCMKRSDIWRAVQALDCPLLTSWFCFFFHKPPSVHFSADPSSPFDMSNSVQYILWEGVAQGDPCSSLLFVITLSFILRGFRRRHPQALLATVIDDTCISLPPSHAHALPAVIADYANTLQLHNLHINKPKTIVYCNSDFAFDIADMPYTFSHDGFNVCRIAVGAPHFTAAQTQSILTKIHEAEALFSRLHAALYNCKTQGRGLIFLDILRLCFISRWQWHMRTLTPSAACRVALAADSAAHRLVHLVLPHHPALELPPIWNHLHIMHTIKLSLPLKKGGLGMRAWHSLLHVCHFASWAEAGPRILLFLQHHNASLPTSIATAIGLSVSALKSRLENDPEFWVAGNDVKRFKLQHHLTDQTDDADFTFGSTLSHDPAVNGQFIGSCLPHMSLPFNAPAIPRTDLNSCNQDLFPYALAFHSMMPLFPQDLCICGESVDPLGLHFASCLKLNARNLLHNALRDCLCGAARHIVSDIHDHNIAFIKSDSIAKSATYIHAWYPRRDPNVPILERQRQPGSHPRVAPSKSPDVLIAFLDDPHHPVFGDFVFASPNAREKTQHSQAAQVAHRAKLLDYNNHHVFSPSVFFPLAAERSGYLHPSFVDFIDLIVQRASNSPPLASHKLQLLYSISHAITYMTAAFLRSASFQFVPSSVKSLMPPPPFITPVRWAPKINFHRHRHKAATIGAPPHSNGVQRHRRADTQPLPSSDPPAPSERLGPGPAPCASGGRPYETPSEMPARPSSFSTGSGNGRPHLGLAV
jgi:hypothetical protein